MAAKQNLDIDAGSTFRFDVTYLSADGSPIDLTNSTVKSQIRRHHADTDVLAEFNAQITVAASGQMSFSLTSSQTSSMECGEAFYDIEITNNTDTIRVLEGTITINPEVTRG